MQFLLLRCRPMLPLAICLLALIHPLASVEAAPLTRFTVTVAGQGPDVLLIPGLACPATVWDATVTQLKATHRLHVLQVAGFAGAPVAGNSEGEVMAPLIEEIAAYIEDQKLQAPAIIGHSMGGFAALALAARHPALTGRIMILDASPFFPALMDPAATVESSRSGADALRDRFAEMSPAMYAAAQPTILQRMIKNDAARSELGPVIGKSDPKVVARAMHDLLTTDLRPELVKITVPLTVLYAFDESLGYPMAAVDDSMKSVYAKAPSARLIRIEGSYHFIMLDQPEKFAAAVEEFLK